MKEKEAMKERKKERKSSSCLTFVTTPSVL
jgi:hypothetical protein